jgi:tetratricopeptide (TPR) repeat protein
MINYRNQTLCTHYKFKEARKHLLKAIKLDPTAWQPYSLISNTYYEMGKYKLAAEFYTQTRNLLTESVKIISVCPLGMPEKDELIELSKKMLQSREVPYVDLTTFAVDLLRFISTEGIRIIK